MTDNGFALPTAAESYSLMTAVHGTKSVVLVAGYDTAGVYGVGQFLRLADYSAAGCMTLATPLNLTQARLMIRGPYFAIHCANWYETISDTVENGQIL